jgi:hypothetical protein
MQCLICVSLRDDLRDGVVPILLDEKMKPKTGGLLIISLLGAGHAVCGICAATDDQ